MDGKLFDLLKLRLSPVAIYFTEEKPSDGLYNAQKLCAGNGLKVAAKGKAMFFDRDTYEGCPGGKAGLGFAYVGEDDDAYVLECYLSTGEEALAQIGKTAPFPLGRGERFFASPEHVRLRNQNTKKQLTLVPTRYIIFRPFQEVAEVGKPDLVCIFANPDQISALVVIAGFRRSELINVVAPFGAACQSVSFAYQETRRKLPRAILGLFDLSQRPTWPKDLLSFTVPYAMFQEMADSAAESCLTTEAWEKLDARLSFEHPGASEDSSVL